MTTILVYRDGAVREAEAIDPAWLEPGAREILWVDIAKPGEAERRLLSDTFHITDAVMKLFR